MDRAGQSLRDSYAAIDSHNFRCGTLRQSRGSWRDYEGIIRRFIHMLIPFLAWILKTLYRRFGPCQWLALLLQVSFFT